MLDPHRYSTNRRCILLRNEITEFIQLELGIRVHAGAWDVLVYDWGCGVVWVEVLETGAVYVDTSVGVYSGEDWIFLC